MTNDPKDADSKAPQSREERLAAQLRANLRRRKSQARALSGAEAKRENDPGPIIQGDGK